MKAEVIRKPMSFRLRTDVVEIMRKKAALANRTLNNYIESLLIEIAYADEPNATTKAAILQAMQDKEKKESYDNVNDLMANLLKE